MFRHETMPDEEEKSESSRCQQIIILRHGERRDGSLSATPEKDPPLTPEGIADVKRVAQCLRDVLDDKTAECIQLVSSPFLRTRQTADALKANGVGAHCEIEIDNTLSEVYGPSRIKAGNPDLEKSEVAQRGAGDLPVWGETLDEAATRYCESFLRNANRAQLTRGRRHKMVPLLVTHGDALGAIVHHFYPSRVVYLAEYLSFLVMEQVSPGSSIYRIIHTEAVEWILDGEDEDPEERVQREFAECEDALYQSDVDLSVTERSKASLHLKWSEGCKSGCPPFVQPHTLQSSSNHNGHISAIGAATQRNSLKSSDFVSGWLLHLASMTFPPMNFFVCNPVPVLLFSIGVVITLSAWLSFMYVISCRRTPLHHWLKWLLMGCGATPCAPPESPHSNISYIFVARVVLLSVLMMSVMYAVGLLLSLLSGQKFAVANFYNEQFYHFVSVCAFVGFTSLTVAGCRCDMRILLAIAQV